MLKQIMKGLVIGAAFALAGTTGSHAFTLGNGDIWTAPGFSGLIVKASAAQRCRARYGPVRRGSFSYGSANYNLWTKSCWSCPVGFRLSGARNVKGRRACRRPALRRYAGARYRGRPAALGRCPRGAFLHIPSRACYVCPAGYKKTLAGIRSPRKCAQTLPARFTAALYRGRPPARQCGGLNERPCPVLAKGRTCNKGLRRNWLANRCTPSGPAQLRARADRTLNDLKPLLRGALAVKYCQSFRGRVARLRALLKTRNARELADWPRRDPCLRRIRAAAKSGGYQTFTFGIGGDIQFGLGVNSELGVAFDVDLRRPPRFFATVGWSAGWGASVGNDLVVGFYKATNDRIAGRSQGFVYAGKALGGGGAAIWYNMRGVLAGATAFVSAGVGGEVGVYNRVRTSMK